MNTPATILDQISQMTADHAAWGRRDFVFAQSLLWAGIISSVVAGILAVLWNPQTMKGKTGKIILASIPAFAITAEQSFKFCQRYQWHDEYYARLHALENSLRYEDAKEAAVSASESEVTKLMFDKFPTMTVQEIIPSESIPKSDQ